jgi:mannose-6-phosphate isomerase
VRALDAPELIEEADRIFAQLDESHAHPDGGYHETLPPRSPRRQNPHMHLFEASGRERHLARARDLLKLLEQRFFDASRGNVHELLGEGLAPFHSHRAELVEPGHAFEWVALIWRDCRLSGLPVPACAERLYHAARRAALAGGAVPLSATSFGAPVDRSRRIWPQTEALRAHVALASVGDQSAAQRAMRQLDEIFKNHLDPAPEGGWVDHIDADGRPLVDFMTAATGYHVVTAFAEL